MRLARALIISVFSLLAAGFAQAGAPNINFNLTAPSALSGQSLTVPWGQNTISWSQLQNIFASNPGFSQYNLQFPNGSSWNVAPAQMQSLYASYAQQARTLGYEAKNMPDMMFSSLGNTVSNGMIPISNMTGNVQSQITQALRELRYKELDLSDSLPDWLKNAIVWVYNAIAAAAMYIYDNFWSGWDYVSQKFREYV